MRMPALGRPRSYDNPEDYLGRIPVASAPRDRDDHLRELRTGSSWASPPKQKVDQRQPAPVPLEQVARFLAALGITRRRVFQESAKDK